MLYAFVGRFLCFVEQRILLWRRFNERRISTAVTGSGISITGTPPTWPKLCRRSTLSTISLASHPRIQVGYTQSAFTIPWQHTIFVTKETKEILRKNIFHCAGVYAPSTFRQRCFSLLHEQLFSLLLPTDFSTIFKSATVGSCSAASYFHNYTTINHFVWLPTLLHSHISSISFVRNYKFSFITNYFSPSIFFSNIQPNISQDYWFFWTFPLSGILETRKHDISETICFRPQVKG
jgi:hypothetical protein